MATDGLGLALITRPPPPPPPPASRSRRCLQLAVAFAVATATAAASLCAQPDQRCTLLTSASGWWTWPSPALEGWLFALSLVLLLGAFCAARCGGAVDPEASELDRAGWLSWFTFWWVTPTLSKALAQGTLELPDLPRLPATDDPRGLMARLARAWPAGRARLSAYRLFVSIVFSTQRRVFTQEITAQLHTNCHVSTY